MNLARPLDLVRLNRREGREVRRQLLRDSGADGTSTDLKLVRRNPHRHYVVGIYLQYRNRLHLHVCERVCVCVCTRVGGWSVGLRV